MVKKLPKHLNISVFDIFWFDFLLIEKRSTHQAEKPISIYSKKIILLTGFSEFYKPENRDLSNLHQELHKIIAKKI